MGRRGRALTRGGALQTPPLRHAAGQGEVEVVRSLLEAGASNDVTEASKDAIVLPWVRAIS